jgi:hypothetical protein
VSSGCPEICQTEGLPLYWPTRSLSYVLNQRGFPDLTDKQVRSILERSFDPWTQVKCDGAPIQLAITQSKGSTTLEAGPRELEPNANAIAHINAGDWQDEPRAFAITKIWYNARNGHILGADMLINGHMDPFGVCPEPAGCPDDDGTTDLRNVVTHEAGHFFGLAHSDDQDSTMWCDAAPGNIDKRTLHDDDIAGICAIYGPGADPGPPVARDKSTGGILCSAAPSPDPSGQSLGLGGFTVFALAGLFGSRRMRARRSPLARPRARFDGLVKSWR